MVRCIYGKSRKTRRGKIRNEMVRVAPIGDKLWENRLRLFGQIQCRTLDAMVKKSDKITGNDNARGEGKTEIDMGHW